MQRQAPIRYGASYKSTTALAANTPEAVFAPGSNVNGAIVHIAEFCTGNVGGGVQQAGFLSKTAAPATVIDGDPIAIGQCAFWSATTVLVYGGLKQGDVFIPAGRGLYFITNVAEGITPHRHVEYTLL